MGKKVTKVTQKKKLDIEVLYNLKLEGFSDDKIAGMFNLCRKTIVEKKQSKEYKILQLENKESLNDIIYQSARKIYGTVKGIVTDIEIISKMTVKEKENFKLKLSALRTLSYFCNFSYSLNGDKKYGSKNKNQRTGNGTTL